MRGLLLLAAVVLLAGAGGTGRTTACAGLTGSFAYAKAGALNVVDFPSCRDRVVVVRGVRGAVRFSADGQWIAFDGGSVPAAGGTVVKQTGVWGPRGHVLAWITREGGALVDGRRVVPDGWGAYSLLWTRQGDLLIGRSLFPRKPYHQEIWLWHASTRNLQLVAGAFRGLQAPELAAASPDGNWVFWWPRIQNSNSLAADGMPLQSKRIAAGVVGPQIANAMLLWDDFLTWCGGRLVVAAGGDRMTTRGKRLVLAGPPTWTARPLSRDRSRSWVSPSCSRDGRRIAAAAGRNYVEPRFGREHRSIWLLRPQRRQLTSPPAGASDELPRWSRDGKRILFVRSGHTNRNANATGSVYLARLDGPVAGPIARLGQTGNYYGHYGWASQTDWWQPGA